MALKTISVQFDEGLLARVDGARGDVPRQRWLARVVERSLGGKQETVSIGDLGVKTTTVKELVANEDEIEASFGPRLAALSDAAAAAETGHKHGCGCLNCERARGRIS